jgi:hypothetical protein
MTDLPQAAIPSEETAWYTESWMKIRPRFITVAAELILSVEVLAALGLFYAVFRFMILLGVPAYSLDFLEQVDLWAAKAVFLTFSVGFVIQVVLGTYFSAVASKSPTKEET